MNKDIQSIKKVLFSSLSTFINRFREKPFYHFTESDLHSALYKDLMTNNSSKMTVNEAGHNNLHKGKLRQSNLHIGLVHHEYPGKFRFKKSDLLKMADKEDEQVLKSTSNGKDNGHRGHFDLAILNPNFVKKVFEMYETKSGIDTCLKHIINKDNQLAVSRKKDFTNTDDFYQEVIYAIEMKFITPFNARSQSVLVEIAKDDQKLRLAYLHSKGFIKPINIVFCSSEEKTKRDKEAKSMIKKVQNYVTGEKVKLEGKNWSGTKIKSPQEVVNIFVESYIDPDNYTKKTLKPLISQSPKHDWVNELKDEIKAEYSR